MCVCMTVCVCISCRDHYSITGQVCRPQGGFYENEKRCKADHNQTEVRSAYLYVHGTCESVRVYIQFSTCACICQSRLI